MVMRILLLTPPMIQLNTPYPATPYLTGFLREQGYECYQADPAIELVCRLFSKNGLLRVYEALQKKWPETGETSPASVCFFMKNFEKYRQTIEGVILFLQGKNDTFAHRLVMEDYLPRGRRFTVTEQFDAGDDGDPLAWAFGSLGLVDRARHIASLYIDDLSDTIKEGIDEDFELARYGERLAASAPFFDPLLEKLIAAPSIIDEILGEICQELYLKYHPNLLGITAPFPGNIYGAFKIANYFKTFCPEIKTVLGGGFVSTELRQLKDVRVFDFFDYLTLDDGQSPFICILENEKNNQQTPSLLRTLVKDGNQVKLISDPSKKDFSFEQFGTPTYDGLPLQNYLSMLEMLNPVNRLWSSGRWNKLIMAHGCYWKRCNFCDINLDYIERYEEQSAKQIVDQMETLVSETGQTGFHFVDEAAPPKIMLAIAKLIIERGMQVTWWGNVRFEKTFTPKVARILARSGCIAITGGLEVASDRLLNLMNKGVTVEQVARVTKAFSDAGILVHAYLMYGFPSETIQETVDSLERVRQLFSLGCLHSAFWHRFVATVHSPIGRQPERFNIKIKRPEIPPTFAQNDLEYVDSVNVNHDLFSSGLRKSVYNFMHGVALDEDVRFWFDTAMPKARVAKNLIKNALLPNHI